ncbi:hypothetical protein [Butyrivibrio sp. JL13D10]|uniref:hypothetical protein n=1 Tax=Butyrivibrio sp. JL13D10 TaxID=3236815 RepID=UPI0038B5F76F
MDKFFMTLKQDPDLRANFGAKLHGIDGDVAKIAEEFNNNRNKLILDGMSEFAQKHGYTFSPEEVRKAYIEECRKIDVDYKTFYKGFFMDDVTNVF